MTEKKQEHTSEEEKLKAGGIKKHVGKLLIYMDDELKRWAADKAYEELDKTGG